MPDFPDWYHDAPCKGKGDLFFPAAGNRGGTTKRALAICEGCPYKAPCLRLAIENDEVGIWGGTTEEERPVSIGGSRHGTAGGYKAGCRGQCPTSPTCLEAKNAQNRDARRRAAALRSA